MGAIDTHCHLYVTPGALSAPLLDGVTELFGPQLEKLNRPMEPAALRAHIEKECFDPAGEGAIGKMEAAGIDTSFVVVGGFSFDSDAPGDAFEKQNRDVAAVIRRWPRQLVGFAGVHPRVADPLALVRCAVEEWGMRGLKLDPLAGRYYPTDPAMAPVYRYASDHRLPIVFHSGPRPEDASDWAHPRPIAAILDEFPDLTVIAAHMSFAWWREFCEVARGKARLLADVSAFQMTAATNPTQFRRVLRRVIDAVGADRILFGVDGPFFDIFLDRRQWLQHVRELPATTHGDVAFRSDEIEKIVGQNARSLLATL
jgi:predicted TIM-barrel fold metal-dependent hydrolase